MVEIRQKVLELILRMPRQQQIGLLTDDEADICKKEHGIKGLLNGYPIQIVEKFT